MRKCLGFLLLFACLLFVMPAISLPAFAKDRFPSETIPWSAGIVANYWTPQQMPAYNTSTFNEVMNARFSLVRFLPDWQLIEKQKGVYDWSYTDWMFGQFVKRRMRPLIGLGLNNPLYGVYTRIDTPEQREAFGKFVRAMVRRYHGRQVIWELWNEPNIPHFWRPHSGETLTSKQAAQEYMEMLKVIAPIVREEDPQALFIGPSAANYNTPWMLYALQMGMMSYFDALSVHPYQANAGRPELVIAQHNQVHGWIPLQDRNKPVIFSEWGYTTGVGTGEVSQEVQRNFVQRQYLLSLMLGVNGNFTYGMADQGKTNPCTNKGVCYGLFGRYSGKPKLAFYGLKDLQTKLAGFRYLGRVGGPKPTVYIMKFGNYRGDVRYAAWDSQTTSPIPVTLPDKQKIQVTQAPQVVEGCPKKNCTQAQVL